jgi:hypothetical protein
MEVERWICEVQDERFRMQNIAWIPASWVHHEM